MHTKRAVRIASGSVYVKNASGLGCAAMSRSLPFHSALGRYLDATMYSPFISSSMNGVTTYSSFISPPNKPKIRCIVVTGAHGNHEQCGANHFNRSIRFLSMQGNLNGIYRVVCPVQKNASTRKVGCLGVAVWGDKYES